MTTTIERAPATTVAPTGPRRPGLLAAAGVLVTVAVLAQLPLLGNRIFYYWDDSAVQFLPMWHHLGEVIANGGWPPVLDLESWMGGNLAAEALFGIYNPINVANYLLVAEMPDLAVAAALVKTEFLMLLALGTYLLAREYGAGRGAAAVVAIALPFSGFTLYYDASTWAAGLMSFAYVPFVWWASRRAATKRLNPVWAFLIGALAITSGNPYGLLGICVVVVGLLAEFAMRRLWREAGLLTVLAVCVGLVVPLVFLPLLGSAPVTWRTTQGVSNTGFLVPNITDLATLSTPSYLPRMPAFGGVGLTEPATYFAWFVMPLLPWLDWRALRRRVRMSAAAFVVAGGYLLLALGPSNLWMFRWPLRLVEYGYLGLVVVFAVALSAGLRTGRARRRAAGSALIMLVGAYLAWAGVPDEWQWHLAGLALVAILTAVAIATHRLRPRLFAAALTGGTAVVLGFQLAAFPGNFTTWPFNLPHSVRELRETFADRYRGETMQVANIHLAKATVGLRPDGAWQHFLLGNSYLVTGVDSVVSYTGLGFRDFADTFCMDNVTSTCAGAYPALWRPTSLGGVPLADLMRVETVVVQNALVPEVTVPPGWRVAERDEVVTVLWRNQRLPWPDGRLSWASPGVRISADNSRGPTEERLRFTAQGPGPHILAFARLAWPGYEAQVNGQDVAVSQGPAGLLTVRLPAGTSEGELTLHWTPPGIRLGIASATVGLAGALALGVFALRGRARRLTAPPADA